MMTVTDLQEMQLLAETLAAEIMAEFHATYMGPVIQAERVKQALALGMAPDEKTARLAGRAALMAQGGQDVRIR